MKWLVKNEHITQMFEYYISIVCEIQWEHFSVIGGDKVCEINK